MGTFPSGRRAHGICGSRRCDASPGSPRQVIEEISPGPHQARIHPRFPCPLRTSGAANVEGPDASPVQPRDMFSAQPAASHDEIGYLGIRFGSGNKIIKAVPNPSW